MGEKLGFLTHESRGENLKVRGCRKEKRGCKKKW